MNVLLQKENWFYDIVNTPSQLTKSHLSQELFYAFDV